MKRIISLIILIVVFVSVPMQTYAEEDVNKEEYINALQSYDLSSFDKLDDDTYTFLESTGFLNFDYENLINLSFDDLKNEIVSVLKGAVETPFKAMLSILVFIILSSLFKSMKPSVQDDELSSMYSTVSALVISVILLMKLKTTIALACSTISVCSDFMFAFVPAFCAIVATSGSAVSAFSTNTLLLTLAQILNYISKNIFIPLSNAFLAIGICSGIRSELNLGGITAFLKKNITTAISVCAAGFVSILSIKTAVASRADAIGLRSIRFAINSVVPVIGSAISEGLLSIQSYSSLIRSSVGVVGIIAVAVVFLPAILEVAMWRVFLNLSVLVSETFCDSSVSSVIKAFCDALLIMNVVLILSMVTTIISIGILVAARGSA